MKIEIVTKDVDQFGARLASVRTRMISSTRDLDREFGEILVNKIRAQIATQYLIASGAYLRSWRSEYLGFLKGVMVTTDRPYARRLEYGFFGTDSLGRNYRQFGRPHIRPAILAVQPRYTEAYRRLVRNLWRK